MTDEELREYGFEPWHAKEEGPPIDWRRGYKVLYRGGFVGSLNSEESYHWKHDQNADAEIMDIIGYPTTASIMAQTKDFGSRDKDQTENP